MLNTVLKNEFLDEIKDSKLNIIYSNTFQDGSEVLTEILKYNLENNKDDFDVHNIFLVPSNFTLTIETLVCQTLGKGSYFNLEFLHLNEFIKNKIENQNRHYLTKQSSIILISNIIKNFREQKYESNLNFFKKITENSMSKILEIKNIIYRFRSLCLTSDDVIKLKNNDEKKQDIFNKKIEDVANIYKEYEKEINKKYLDDFTLIEIFKNLIANNRIDLSKYNFYITEVTELTKQEVELYKILIQKANSFSIVVAKEKEKNQVKEISINKETLLIEADEREIYPFYIYQSVKEIKEKLPFDFSKEISYYKKENNYFTDFIRDNLFSYNNKKINRENNFLDIYSAKTKEEEVEFVALDIKRKIVENNNEFSDFNIAITKLDDYKNIISTVFNKYKIPIFLNDAICLYQSKIFNYIKDILILNTQPQKDSYFSLLYNPYFLCESIYDKDNMTLKNSFEIFIKKYKIDILRLKEENIDRIFSLKNYKNEYIETELNIEDIKQVFNKFQEIKSIFKNNKKTLSNKISVIKLLLNNKENKQIDDQILENSLENRNSLDYEITKTAKDKLIELLDTIKLIYKDENLSLDTILEFLIFSSKDINLNDVPLFPNTVYCADLYDSMFIMRENLYILGCNSDLMPLVDQDNLIIKRNDFIDQIEIQKNQNDNKNIYLYNQLIRDKNRSKFKIIQTITKAIKNTVLTYSSTSQQKTSAKSNVLIELNNMFFDRKKEIKEINLEEDKFLKYKIKEKDIEKREKDADVSSVIKDFLTDKKGIKNTNVTMISEHKKCSLKCFVNNILKIKDNLNFENTIIDVGNISHEVLEIILKEEDIIKIYLNDNNLNEDEENKIKEKVDNIFDNIVTEKQKRTKDEEVFFEIVKQQIKQTVLEVIKDIKKSEFKPFDFEYQANKSQIEYDNNSKLSLYGKIDRIDKNNNSFSILDYKSSHSNFSKATNLKGIQNIEETADLLQHSVYCELLSKDQNFKDSNISYLEYYNLDNRIKSKNKVRRYILLDSNNFFEEIKKLDNIFKKYNISKIYENTVDQDFKRIENEINKYFSEDKKIYLELEVNEKFKKDIKRISNIYKIENMTIQLFKFEKTIKLDDNQEKVECFYKMRMYKNDEEDIFMVEALNFKNIINKNVQDLIEEFKKIEQGDIKACNKDTCEICKRKIDELN